MTNLAALLTLSMMTPTLTQADSAQGASDVQCALASNVVATASKDDKQKQTARDMAHFYLGRIDGRLSASQLKFEIAAQKKALTPGNFNAVMQSCLEVALRKLKVLQEMAR
jgi:hypothetical protein